MLRINSKDIKKGDTFLAIGDGVNYINEAINLGATKIICKEGEFCIPTINVSDPKKYLYDYIDTLKKKIEDIKLIGITGTNGKTTSCYLIYQALNKVNLKCAYIGTIGFYLDKKIKDLNNTTPGILDIYEMILEAKKNGCKYVVMEVSSHALAQDRVYSLLYDIAIITNLTEDHLDYHKNMEDYAKAKQKLFNKVKKDGFAIIPDFISYKDKFIMDNNNIIYGTSGDYIIESIKLSDDYSTFSLIHNGLRRDYKIKLLGNYNIYNMVNTIIVLDILGFSNSEALVSNLEMPKGRMEVIPYNGFKIIIDYAHTPDAINNVIKSVKEICSGNIYAVLGCGGNRDKFKRPLMALEAVQNTTLAIFTTDNPRLENPSDIICDMVDGLENENYIIVLNRKNAIIKGIQKCMKNDILLILGKGHENYQIINNEKIHFDDSEIVLEYIRR